MSSHCKACGRELIWAKTILGANIPLDAKSQVYTLVDVCGTMQAKAVPGFYVSHASICIGMQKYFGKKAKKTEEAKTDGGENV